MDPLAVKPEMIVDLALGFKPHDQICAKYEIDDQTLFKLFTQDWFNKAIADKRVELEKAGFNFTAKMKMMAEDMLIDAYHAAKLSDAVTPKLDVAKHLCKVAGLEPQPNAQQVAGTGFAININFNGGKETITLETTHDAKSNQGPPRSDVWTFNRNLAVDAVSEDKADTVDMPLSVRDVVDASGLDASPRPDYLVRLPQSGDIE